MFFEVNKVDVPRFMDEMNLEFEELQRESIPLTCPDPPLT